MNISAPSIGWDAGISITGAIDNKSLHGIPLSSRAVDILHTCEELRRTGSFDEATKAKLREPGKEFSLLRDAAKRWRFRPAHYDTHTASVAEPWSLVWTMTNPFESQPVKVRIEALMSAGSYDDPNNIILTDLSNPNTFSGFPRAADGVKVALSPTRSSGPPEPAGIFAARNSGKVPRNAAWARLDRKFDPCLNLKDKQALGVWVEGDGRGEIIAIRLESPRHICFGAVADRYIKVDFTGKRLFTLVETESTRWSDYVWNDGKWLYNVYRETVDFGTIEFVSIWYNNLPKGQKTECTIGPIKALPMLTCMVKNPTVAVNGKTIILPVEMQSSCYLEFSGGNDCVLYGPKGEVITTVMPDGSIPVLSTGANQVRFSCDAVDGPDSRVKLTVISHSEPLLGLLNK